jgi:hypothetical protein
MLPQCLARFVRSREGCRGYRAGILLRRGGGWAGIPERGALGSRPGGEGAPPGPGNGCPAKAVPRASVEAARESPQQQGYPLQSRRWRASPEGPRAGGVCRSWRRSGRGPQRRTSCTPLAAWSVALEVGGRKRRGLYGRGRGGPRTNRRASSGSGRKGAVEAIRDFIPQPPGCRQGTSLAPVAWHNCPAAKGGGASGLRTFGSTTRPRGRGGASA